MPPKRKPTSTAPVRRARSTGKAESALGRAASAVRDTMRAAVRTVAHAAKSAGKPVPLASAGARRKAVPRGVTGAMASPARETKRPVRRTVKRTERPLKATRRGTTAAGGARKRTGGATSRTPGSKAAPGSQRLKKR
jgi:hypothetical protein